MDNYVQLLERISSSSGLAVDEIERKVEAKRAKLSGLVSKEGAAQIVAAELGINFEKEKMKISQLVEGMKKANVVGKVIEINPVRSFSKNGRDGKVASLLLADENSNIRLVLWDTNHIGLVESKSLKEGDIIEVSNASMRNGELHLSSFGDIKQSKEQMGEVMVGKVFSSAKLSDARPGQSIKSRAVIVQVFEPRYFEVCPECGKRVHEGQCQVHGTVEGKKRALLNVVLDDGTESIRSVLFGENILKLGLSEEEIFSLEKFAEKKNSLLGEEKVFAGIIKSNALYNTNEFNINDISEINADDIIKELESKA